jgi:hypothetical protein
LTQVDGACSEEGILDRAELSPEDWEAKQQAGAELMKLQWAIRACAASLSEDQQKQFHSDVEAAMKAAARQVSALSCDLLKSRSCRLMEVAMS